MRVRYFSIASGDWPKFWVATRSRVSGINLRIVHRGIGGFCFLDLQRFINQVAQHLHAQTIQFLTIHLVAIGRNDERQTLFNVSACDNLAIDDGRGAADVGIVLAEHDRIGRNVERRICALRQYRSDGDRSHAEGERGSANRAGYFQSGHHSQGYRPVELALKRLPFGILGLVTASGLTHDEWRIGRKRARWRAISPRGS
jgi:hypothetical protein